ncbi:FAD-dependent oxidoreductase [Nannocystis pusilla]|uniref:FAD-dependent oxidoreductase n=1 Tax=Nannocystis pusilla TaxID=889268 RepID=UPI003B7CDF52
MIQATSPYLAPRSFWCVVKTLAAAELHPRPYHAHVPSFGDWGFVLVSPAPRPEPTRLADVPLRFLDDALLPTLFVFPATSSRPRSTSTASTTSCWSTITKRTCAPCPAAEAADEHDPGSMSRGTDLSARAARTGMSTWTCSIRLSAWQGLRVKRRDFLGATAGTVASAACGPVPPPPPAVEFVGPDPERGHHLREGTWREGPVHETIHTEVAIVGGGAAGSAAAWRLRRAGLADVHLFELEDDVGGTARGGELPRSRHPLGAHYLPTPPPGCPALERLLEELGVILGRDARGRPEYAPSAIAAAPLERHFGRGRWYEGLYPAAGETADEAAQWARWHAHLRDLDGRRGAEGRPCSPSPSPAAAPSCATSTPSRSPPTSTTSASSASACAGPSTTPAATTTAAPSPRPRPSPACTTSSPAASRRPAAASSSPGPRATRGSSAACWSAPTSAIASTAAPRSSQSTRTPASSASIAPLTAGACACTPGRSCGPRRASSSAACSSAPTRCPPAR